ncbi:S8 family peptidase, partial [Brotaphodocola sp.]|uniref:S8 family peptidase n=1 Tax=Brotaphodocola sp. TaxID=3073577 RepID=UPI003D7D1505
MRQGNSGSQNQKLDNVLNLALEVSPEERARSQELETGYDPAERRWELIIKYSGSLDALKNLASDSDMVLEESPLENQVEGESGTKRGKIIVEEMRNEYAILTVPESLIDWVSALPQIEYVEKPKRLFFSETIGTASCISALQEPFEESGGLTGSGTIVAVADSGIDWFHEDFRNPDGTTRILALWDQTLGRVFTREEINEALAGGDRNLAYRALPSVDSSGHGTAVAGIAAGNGRARQGRYRGVAYGSELLVIKLGNQRADLQSGGFPRTTEVMRAVNFAVWRAVEENRPLALNLSFGNTYGSHDGSSLLETFLDDIGNYGRTTIVVGSGNEGASSGHVSGIVRERRNQNLGAGESENGAGFRRTPPGENAEEARVELLVGEYENGFSVQLWKDYTDQFEIRLQTPTGEILGPLSETLGPVRYRYRKTQILIYYGKPGPYSLAQEIYFDFVPDEGAYVETGDWTFWIRAVQTVAGRYDLWLPSAGILGESTRFLRPSPDTTLTIPSCAQKVITVGAYNSAYQSYADFSGRGFTRKNQFIKPDLVAPGVGLMAPSPGGGYRQVTGTSFAAPVVTG